MWRGSGKGTGIVKNNFSLEKRRSLCGYVFTAPWIIGFGVFMLLPLLINLIMSFSKIVNALNLQMKFVGWNNYIRLFKTDVNFLPAFFDTLKNTFLWTPFILVFALFLAILLNRNIRFKGVFRVIFFMPVLLGTGYIMQQVSGAANILQMPDDIKSMIQYYFSKDLADFFNQLLTQIMKMFWQTGIQVVIFLSGLQSIPDSYYEAARVDNGNNWDCFWKITLPMLSPVILLNLIYTIIDNFRSTDNKIAALIVNMVFKNADYEYGAAMGWVYFTVTILIVGLVFLIMRRFITYEK